MSFRSPRAARALSLKDLQCTRLPAALRFHIINQLTIIGFLGKTAETKYLPNGTPVVKFSVATKKSWKDENDTWKEKTQWHNVVAFGKGFAQTAERLGKGAHVFVQGELVTREYDRTITVPSGKKSIEHVIKQMVVGLKADTIRTMRQHISCASDTNRIDFAVKHPSPFADQRICVVHIRRYARAIAHGPVAARGLTA